MLFWCLQATPQTLGGARPLWCCVQATGGTWGSLGVSGGEAEEGVHGRSEGVV